MNMIINHYVNYIIINDVDHFVHLVKNQLGLLFFFLWLFFKIFTNFSSGRCITAMGRKYHVEHFICSYCTRQLQNGTFKEYQNKPYCHPCFVKLFAWTVFQYIDHILNRIIWEWFRNEMILFAFQIKKASVFFHH